MDDVVSTSPGVDRDQVDTVTDQQVQQDSQDHRPPRRQRPRHYRTIVALIAPALLLIGVIIIYPLLSGIDLSVHSDPVLNRQNGFFYPGGYVGIENYSYWLTQQCSTGVDQVTCPPGNLAQDFWHALGNTMFFTVVTVLLETIIGIGMAIVMAQHFRGRGLLRAAVLVPWAIPTAITAKLWAFLFAEQGIINSLLGTTVAWQTDPWAARFSIILADVWKTTPFMALLILAGIQMIPKDLYEAARVDGASAWQRFTRITLPLAKGSIVVAVLFRMLDALRMYDLPYIMVGPNPDSPTATVSQLVVAAIRQDQVNSASALSTLIFLLIFAIALFFVKVLGARIGVAEPSSSSPLSSHVKEKKRS